MLSLRTNSLKRGLSRTNRAISACSLGDLLIIGKARVRVIMTCAFHAHCLHNVIVVPVSFQPLSPFMAGPFFLAWSRYTLCELRSNSQLAPSLACTQVVLVINSLTSQDILS